MDARLKDRSDEWKASGCDIFSIDIRSLLTANQDCRVFFPSSALLL